MSSNFSERLAKAENQLQAQNEKLEAEWIRASAKAEETIRASRDRARLLMPELREARAQLLEHDSTAISKAEISKAGERRIPTGFNGVTWSFLVHGQLFSKKKSSKFLGWHIQAKPAAKQTKPHQPPIRWDATREEGGILEISSSSDYYRAQFANDYTYAPLNEGIEKGIIGWSRVHNYGDNPVELSHIVKIDEFLEGCLEKIAAYVAFRKSFK